MAQKTKKSKGSNDDMEPSAIIKNPSHCTIEWEKPYRIRKLFLSEPFKSAFTNNAWKMSGFMKKGKLNINGVDKYLRTPLHYAAYKGNRDVVNTMLFSSYDIKGDYTLKDSDGRTALFKAVEADKRACAKDLLIAGDVDSTDKDGIGVLHYCAAFDKVHMMDIILFHEPDIELQDNVGRTPLHIAAMYNSLRCCVRLLDAGANIDSLDFVYRTPLFLACNRGHTKMVQLLLARGSNLNALDYYDKHTLDYVKPEIYEEMKEIFLQAEVAIKKEKKRELKRQNALENEKRKDTGKENNDPLQTKKPYYQRTLGLFGARAMKYKMADMQERGEIQCTDAPRETDPAPKEVDMVVEDVDLDPHSSPSQERLSPALPSQPEASATAPTTQVKDADLDFCSVQSKKSISEVLPLKSEASVTAPLSRVENADLDFSSLPLQEGISQSSSSPLPLSASTAPTQIEIVDLDSLSLPSKESISQAPQLLSESRAAAAPTEIEDIELNVCSSPSQDSISQASSSSSEANAAAAPTQIEDIDLNVCSSPSQESISKASPSPLELNASTAPSQTEIADRGSLSSPSQESISQASPSPSQPTAAVALSQNEDVKTDFCSSPSQESISQASPSPSQPTAAALSQSEDVKTDFCSSPSQESISEASSSPLGLNPIIAPTQIENVDRNSLSSPSQQSMSQASQSPSESNASTMPTQIDTVDLDSHSSPLQKKSSQAVPSLVVSSANALATQNEDVDRDSLSSPSQESISQTPTSPSALNASTESTQTEDELRSETSYDESPVASIPGYDSPAEEETAPDVCSVQSEESITSSQSSLFPEEDSLPLSEDEEYEKASRQEEKSCSRCLQLFEENDVIREALPSKSEANVTASPSRVENADLDFSSLPLQEGISQAFPSPLELNASAAPTQIEIVDLDSLSSPSKESISQAPRLSSESSADATPPEIKAIELDFCSLTPKESISQAVPSPLERNPRTAPTQIEIVDLDSLSSPSQKSISQAVPSLLELNPNTAPTQIEIVDLDSLSSPSLESISQAVPSSPKLNPSAAPTKIEIVDLDSLSSPLQESISQASQSPSESNAAAAPTQIEDIELYVCGSLSQESIFQASPSPSEANAAAAPSQIEDIELDICSSPLQESISQASPSPLELTASTAPNQIEIVDLDSLSSPSQESISQASQSPSESNGAAALSQIEDIEIDFCSSPLQKSISEASSSPLELNQKTAPSQIESVELDSHSSPLQKKSSQAVPSPVESSANALATQNEDVDLDSLSSPSQESISQTPTSPSALNASTESTQTEDELRSETSYDEAPVASITGYDSPAEEETAPDVCSVQSEESITSSQSSLFPEEDSLPLSEDEEYEKASRQEENSCSRCLQLLEENDVIRESLIKCQDKIRELNLSKEALMEEKGNLKVKTVESEKDLSRLKELDNIYNQLSSECQNLKETDNKLKIHNKQLIEKNQSWTMKLEEKDQEIANLANSVKTLKAASEKGNISVRPSQQGVNDQCDVEGKPPTVELLAKMKSLKDSYEKLQSELEEAQSSLKIKEASGEKLKTDLNLLLKEKNKNLLHMEELQVDYDELTDECLELKESDKTLRIQNEQLINKNKTLVVELKGKCQEIAKLTDSSQCLEAAPTKVDAAVQACLQVDKEADTNESKCDGEKPLTVDLIQNIKYKEDQVKRLQSELQHAHSCLKENEISEVKMKSNLAALEDEKNKNLSLLNQIQLDYNELSNECEDLKEVNYKLRVEKNDLLDTNISLSAKLEDNSEEIARQLDSQETLKAAPAKVDTSVQTLQEAAGDPKFTGSECDGEEKLSVNHCTMEKDIDQESRDKLLDGLKSLVYKFRQFREESVALQRLTEKDLIGKDIKEDPPFWDKEGQEEKDKTEIIPIKSFPPSVYEVPKTYCLHFKEFDQLEEELCSVKRQWLQISREASCQAEMLKADVTAAKSTINKFTKENQNLTTELRSSVDVNKSLESSLADAKTWNAMHQRIQSELNAKITELQSQLQILNEELREVQNSAVKPQEEINSLRSLKDELEKEIVRIKAENSKLGKDLNANCVVTMEYKSELEELQKQRNNIERYLDDHVFKIVHVAMKDDEKCFEGKVLKLGRIFLKVKKLLLERNGDCTKLRTELVSLEKKLTDLEEHDQQGKDKASSSQIDEQDSTPPLQEGDKSSLPEASKLKSDQNALSESDPKSQEIVNDLQLKLFKMQESGGELLGYIEKQHQKCSEENAHLNCVLRDFQKKMVDLDASTKDIALQQLLFKETQERIKDLEFQSTKSQKNKQNILKYTEKALKRFSEDNAHFNCAHRDFQEKSVDTSTSENNIKWKRDATLISSKECLVSHEYTHAQSVTIAKGDRESLARTETSERLYLEDEAYMTRAHRDFPKKMVDTSTSTNDPGSNEEETLTFSQKHQDSSRHSEPRLVTIPKEKNNRFDCMEEDEGRFLGHEAYLTREQQDFPNKMVDTSTFTESQNLLQENSGFEKTSLDESLAKEVKILQGEICKLKDVNNKLLRENDDLMQKQRHQNNVIMNRKCIISEMKGRENDNKQIYVSLRDQICKVREENGKMVDAMVRRNTSSDRQRYDTDSSDIIGAKCQDKLETASVQYLQELNKEMAEEQEIEKVQMIYRRNHDVPHITVLESEDVNLARPNKLIARLSHLMGIADSLLLEKGDVNDVPKLKMDLQKKSPQCSISGLVANHKDLTPKKGLQREIQQPKGSGSESAAKTQLIEKCQSLVYVTKRKADESSSLMETMSKPYHHTDGTKSEGDVKVSVVKDFEKRLVNMKRNKDFLVEKFDQLQHRLATSNEHCEHLATENKKLQIEILELKKGARVETGTTSNKPSILKLQFSQDLNAFNQARYESGETTEKEIDSPKVKGKCDFCDSKDVITNREFIKNYLAKNYEKDQVIKDLKRQLNTVKSRNEQLKEQAEAKYKLMRTLNDKVSNLTQKNMEWEAEVMELRERKLASTGKGVSCRLDGKHNGSFTVDSSRSGQRGTSSVHCVSTTNIDSNNKAKSCAVERKFQMKSEQLLGALRRDEVYFDRCPRNGVGSLKQTRRSTKYCGWKIRGTRSMQDGIKPTPHSMRYLSEGRPRLLNYSDVLGRSNKYGISREA